MRQWVRVILTGVFASALLGLIPCLISPAHAQSEINLNSSTVQVVHNTAANSDVLNMSLNVTNIGDSGTGDCNSEGNDLLETGVGVKVSRSNCAFITANCPGLFCPIPDFSAGITYVEHDIGNSSYGTSFAPNAGGFVASKIVALTTPPNTCGTWSINLQATGQNLSLITGPKVALLLQDADADGGPPFLGACFDVNVSVGSGLTKPAHGVRRVRHH